MRSIAAGAVMVVIFIACEGRIVGRSQTIVAPSFADAGSFDSGATVFDAGLSEPDPESLLPPFEPGILRARVLIAAQYKNAVESLLGSAASNAITAPPDVLVNGLSVVGASSLSVSSTSVSRYEENAYLAAQAALATQSSVIIGCAPTGHTDRVCMTSVVGRLSRKAFRRAVAQDELTELTNLGLEAALAYKQFNKGVEFAIAAIIQSPSFLYLVETGTPEGSNVRLDDVSLANRLSFFLTNAPPDDALLLAAQNGELVNTEVLRAQTARLLQLPLARQATMAFFDEYFQLREVPDIAKDGTAYPLFDRALAIDMLTESHRTLESVLFSSQSDMRDMFTTRVTYLNGRLSSHYGMAGTAALFQETLLPENQPRRGILTQGAFLSLKAHPADTSPALRGKFIREQLLCQPIDAPPSNVDTSIPRPVTSMPRTLRQRLEQLHLSKASCASCHSQMDPLGFAFETFDTTGKTRDRDLGLPIDPSGTYDDVGSFSGAPQLMQLIHDDPRVSHCLTRAIFRQAVGRVELPAEALPIYRAHKNFAQTGHHYQSLLTELVISDAFRFGKSAP
jgi:hypothetical protein